MIKVRLKPLLLWLFLLPIAVLADVLKPTLVEVSIFPDKRLQLSIDLSLEAAITGIGTQYKNTTDAPNAAQYDVLRQMSSVMLRDKFRDFEAEFLRRIKLTVDAKAVNLVLIDTKIDIRGYTKRPRKSTLLYAANLSTLPKTIRWQYAKIYGDNAWRVRFFAKDNYTWRPWQWLENGQSSGLINLQNPYVISTKQRLLQFIEIGFKHVVPLGWDHILFIIGMALSTLLWRKLLLLISVFTLAHTLTLGLSMLALIEIPARIVEPLIALSIAYIAIENLLNNDAPLRKIIIVFVFGLLHGLGFANVLKTFEMQGDNFITTLIGFNIGVELAQVVIVLSVISILLSLKKVQINYQRWAVIPISIIIAVIGFYWGVERLLA